MTMAAGPDTPDTKCANKPAENAVARTCFHDRHPSGHNLLPAS